jgi:hypothetical protein
MEWRRFEGRKPMHLPWRSRAPLLAPSSSFSEVGRLGELQSLVTTSLASYSEVGQDILSPQPHHHAHRLLNSTSETDERRACLLVSAGR